MTRSPRWTLAIVSIALFMVTLDNLVVTTALPSIRTDLGASIEDLEWTVNAYTLAFTVFLLTGAALGDRLGRRRMFIAGIGIFTVASAAAAVAPDSTTLIAARGLQGLGAAIVAPLTLTLLSEAFPSEKRGAAIGLWSGISGLGVAIGPLVGGAVVDGISWQWIFWLNVPVGLVVIPLAVRRLAESHGPQRALDLRGLALGSSGLLAVTYALIHGNSWGWGSASTLGLLAAGAAVLVAFVAHESRTAEPMLPMTFFRTRGFAATNTVTLSMTFGTFGSIFLLAQFFQTVQGYSAFEAGLRTLPWTAMPMLVAPVAGLLSDRIGSRPLMVTGLGLQAVAMAWLASIMDAGTAYSSFVVPFILAGTGMALVFAPAANAVLQSVRPEQAGQASGATNTIRELGGVMGIAVLAAVFSSSGGYESREAFVEGLIPAVTVGAGVLAFGALAATLVPGVARERRTTLEPATAPA